jgi:hypothetical protein
VTRVKAFSAAYFELLRALPEVGPVLADLTDVVIGGAQASVHVGDEGIEEISTSELRKLVSDFRGVGGA